MEGEKQVTAHIKLTILNEQRDLLTSNLIPDRHMDFLRSRYILSEEDCDEIHAQTTRKKRASKFLDILLMKGEDAYDALCRALELDGTQTFLLKNLNLDFENRLQNYRALFNPPQPVIRIITPPDIQPPPPPPAPPDSLPLRSKSLDPVEHQYVKTPTPPVSPDFTGMASASVSSVSTYLSSEKEGIQKQENRTSFDTVEYMKSLYSTGSNPTMSSLSDRMRDFSLASSSPPSSSNVASSSSSTSVIYGVSESDKSSSHHTRLFSRGSTDDDTVIGDPSCPSPTTQPGGQPADAGCLPGCVVEKINPSTGKTGLCNAVETSDPYGELQESGEFFGSLLQSWVDTSTDSGMSSENRKNSQHDMKKHTASVIHPEDANSMGKQDIPLQEIIPTDSSLSPKEKNNNTVPKTFFHSSQQDDHSANSAGSLGKDSAESKSLAKTQTGSSGNKTQPQNDGSQQTVMDTSCPNLEIDSDGSVQLRLSSDAQGNSSTAVPSASYSAMGSRTSSHC